MSTQIVQFSFGISVFIVVFAIIVLVIVAAAGLASLAFLTRFLGAAWRLIVGDDDRHGHTKVKVHTGQKSD